MGGALEVRASGPRVMLAGIVATGLTLLAPLLLATAGDAPATVSLTVLTLVLAARVLLGGHAAVLAVRVAAVGPPTRDEAPPELAGRITDPTHHPLRPRAPGLA